MKFGDKVKFTDDLWTELTNVINSDEFFLNTKIDSKYNKFLCLKFIQSSTGAKTIWLGTLDSDFTDMCGCVRAEIWSKNKQFENWSFWINYQCVNGIAAKNMSIDSYYGDEEPFPDGWETIVPKEMIVFRFFNKEFLPYEDIKPKPIQSGASCLLCKDYNPWMEPNSFCYVCKTDPRNSFKIQSIMESL